MQFLRKITDSLLDVFLPRSSDVKLLESLDLHDLQSKLPPAFISPEERGQNIHALFNYRNHLTESLIWEIKYRGNKRLIRLVAELIYDEILPEISDIELFQGNSMSKSLLLIPAPQSKKRSRMRGFNQAELLAREIYKIDQEQNSEKNFSLETNLISKIKDTPTQTSLSRRARLENLKDAFEIKNSEKIKNKIIFLIDDVMTTGSTIRELRKVLRKAGAKKILVFTISH